MTLDDTKNIFKWEESEEKEDGYYFVLTDTLHHLDYNVVLFKDDGKVTVNGAYIDNVPHSIAAAIAPRIDYFLAMKKIKECNGAHCKRHDEKKKH